MKIPILERRKKEHKQTKTNLEQKKNNNTQQTNIIRLFTMHRQNRKKNETKSQFRMTIEKILITCNNVI